MNVFIELLTNPATISLLIGTLVGMFTPQRMPRILANFFSIYLIFVVGFKGGACLGVAQECTPPLIMLAIIGAVIGFFQTFIHYGMLHFITNLDAQTRIVLASQYGSISIVTFVTGIAFLAERGIKYDTFMSAIAGIMEIPALFSGMLLLKRKETMHSSTLLSSLLHISYDIITCKKINMLFIGFFAGFLAQYFEMQAVSQWIVAPFTAILIFFMIDIGMKIATQREYFKQFTFPLIAFGICLPIVNGLIGLFIAQYWVGYFGSAILFALLLASASYIAVPTVMATYAPEAKPAIYLPMSLGVTLPFNILIGIPLFYYVGKWLMPALYLVSQMS